MSYPTEILVLCRARAYGAPCQAAELTVQDIGRKVRVRGRYSSRKRDRASEAEGTIQMITLTRDFVIVRLDGAVDRRCDHDSLVEFL